MIDGPSSTGAQGLLFPAPARRASWFVDLVPGLSGTVKPPHGMAEIPRPRHTRATLAAATQRHMAELMARLGGLNTGCGDAVSARRRLTEGPR